MWSTQCDHWSLPSHMSETHGALVLLCSVPWKLLCHSAWMISKILWSHSVCVQCSLVTCALWKCSHEGLCSMCDFTEDYKFGAGGVTCITVDRTHRLLGQTEHSENTTYSLYTPPPHLSFSVIYWMSQVNEWGSEGRKEVIKSLGRTVELDYS